MEEGEEEEERNRRRGEYEHHDHKNVIECWEECKTAQQEG